MNTVRKSPASSHRAHPISPICSRLRHKRLLPRFRSFQCCVAARPCRRAQMYLLEGRARTCLRLSMLARFQRCNDALRQPYRKLTRKVVGGHSSLQAVPSLSTIPLLLGISARWLLQRSRPHTSSGKCLRTLLIGGDGNQSHVCSHSPTIRRFI